MPLVFCLIKLVMYDNLGFRFHPENIVQDTFVVDFFYQSPMINRLRFG
jgi:hypothetical protein